MRLIDADGLIEEANQDGAYGYVSAEQIDNAPTIDAVEVVRCKDCMWRDIEPHDAFTTGCRWYADEQPDDNDFCSYGEMK